MSSLFSKKFKKYFLKQFSAKSYIIYTSRAHARLRLVWDINISTIQGKTVRISKDTFLKHSFKFLSPYKHRGCEGVGDSSHNERKEVKQAVVVNLKGFPSIAAIVTSKVFIDSHTRI